MRPANLIPVEERRDGRGGIGAAPLAYLLVLGLLLAIGAVTLIVVTDNQISTRKAEVAETRQRTASVEAAANALAPFTSFDAVASERVSTISNLANSRFDWVKVLRQLAIVKPREVFIEDLSGSVRSDAAVSGESVGLRAAIPGPALSISGCGVSQQAVADFIVALKDIDGVTRVGLQTSANGNETSGSATEGEAAPSGCSNTHFQLAVAFDAAPISAPVSGGEAVEFEPEAATEEAAPTDEAETEPAAEGE